MERKDIRGEAESARSNEVAANESLDFDHGKVFSTNVASNATFNN